MKPLTFLLSTVIELYTMALLLRIWIQWIHCDFYNPLTQFIVKITLPIVLPLRHIFPILELIDSAAALMVFVLSLIRAVILFTMVTFLPIIWIAAVLILVKTIGLLIFWLLIAVVIISWITPSYSPVEYALILMIKPLIGKIHNLLQSIGGIDFSPVILVLLLYSINMSIAGILRLTGSILLLELWMEL